MAIGPKVVSKHGLDFPGQGQSQVGSCWGRLISPGAFVARPGNVGFSRSIRWGEHPSLPTW